ncbi:hypothetical protein [Spiroplasma endosymbiont of Poecilobothrus nobilitatus]|uniref:hypothetical protein n=1 Tax=Spiroplasma endosymbiont of Poecilobothrus nobilitatus TaxID=1209220 RepID=UPI00313B548A
MEICYDIKKILKLSYEEYWNYLIKKYGKVNGDYFLTTEMKSINNKIKKGNAGLCIHHIDEDKAIMLSTPEFARKSPFNYQKSDRLVYCNLLEHLILHTKIYFLNQNEFPSRFVLNYISQLINIYNGKQYRKKYYKKIAEIVLPEKENFIEYLKYFINKSKCLNYKIILDLL